MLSSLGSCAGQKQYWKKRFKHTLSVPSHRYVSSSVPPLSYNLNVQFEIDMKGDVNAVDCRGFTALMHIVQVLLSSPTLLWMLIIIVLPSQAVSPNMDMISQLLRWKADPSIIDPVYNINALHIACHFCNEHAARLFIHAGASVNATTKEVSGRCTC